MSRLPLSRRRALLSSAVLLLSTACVERRSSSTFDLLEPPDGTGQIRIDMTGTWRLTNVQVIGASGSLSEVSECLVPPREDQTLVIDDAGFKTGNESPLRGADWSSRPDIERYLNLVDGRFAIYDFRSVVPNESDRGHYELRIALGSLLENTMVGLLSFERTGEFLQPGQLRSGLFRFDLVRQR